MICCQVDHERISRQLGGEGSGVPVWQPEEDHVVFGHGGHVGRGKDVLTQPTQVTVVSAEQIPYRGVSADRLQLDGRVSAEQAADLAAGVTGGSGHCRGELNWTRGHNA